MKVEVTWRRNYITKDNWHPDRAHFLFETRRKIVEELRRRDEDAHSESMKWYRTYVWPEKWPNFETYTYTPG